MRDKIIAIAINKQPSGKCAFENIMCRQWQGIRLQKWSTWYEEIDKFNRNIGNGIDTASSRIQHQQHTYKQHSSFDGGGGGNSDGDRDGDDGIGNNGGNSTNNAPLISIYFTGNSSKFIRWFE